MAARPPVPIPGTDAARNRKRSTMKTAPLLPFALSAFVCLSAAAREVRVPPVLPPARLDTECVTNAPLPSAMMARARLVRTSLSLLATPSNNVEIAFGQARRGDGVLLPGDETLAFGWENGAWFLASPTNCVLSAESETSAQRTLDFFLRVREDGTPFSLAVSDGSAQPLFSETSAALPDWLFSRSWDAVRLTVRGTDERNETLSVRLDTDAGMLIIW